MIVRINEFINMKCLKVLTHINAQSLPAIIIIIY